MSIYGGTKEEWEVIEEWTALNSAQFTEDGSDLISTLSNNSTSADIEMYFSEGDQSLLAERLSLHQESNKAIWENKNQFLVSDEKRYTSEGKDLIQIGLRMCDSLGRTHELNFRFTPLEEKIVSEEVDEDNENTNAAAIDTQSQYTEAAGANEIVDELIPPVMTRAESIQIALEALFEITTEDTVADEQYSVADSLFHSAQFFEQATPVAIVTSVPTRESSIRNNELAYSSVAVSEVVATKDFPTEAMGFEIALNEDATIDIQDIARLDTILSSTARADTQPQPRIVSDITKKEPLDILVTSILETEGITPEVGTVELVPAFTIDSPMPDVPSKKESGAGPSIEVSTFSTETEAIVRDGPDDSPDIPEYVTPIETELVEVIVTQTQPAIVISNPPAVKSFEDRGVRLVRTENLTPELKPNSAPELITIDKRVLDIPIQIDRSFVYDLDINANSLEELPHARELARGSEDLTSNGLVIDLRNRVSAMQYDRVPTIGKSSPTGNSSVFIDNAQHSGLQYMPGVPKKEKGPIAYANSNGVTMYLAA
jgi:hypothetical protein